MSLAWQNWLAFDDEAGRPISTSVQLGLYDVAPICDWPYLGRVIIALNKPGDDGLGSEEEAKSLKPLYSLLVDSPADEQAPVRVVGVRTTGGEMEVSFYASSPDALTTISSELRNALSEYRTEMIREEDPAWSYYQQVLFPAHLLPRWADDERAVASLKSQGDNVALPRPVSHVVDFEAGQDGLHRIFQRLMQHFGFEIESETDQDVPQAGRRHVFRVRKVQPADYSSIRESTSNLFLHALQLDGRYRGWETSPAGR